MAEDAPPAEAPPVEAPPTEAPPVEAPAAGGIGGGTPPAEAPAAAGPLDFASEDAYTQFRSSLPEELRDRPMFKETKNLQSLAQQAVDAQSALGKKRIEVPQDDWTDAQWTTHHESLRPETLDGYEAITELDVKLGDGEDIQKFTFAEETTTELKELAHNMGLDTKQFAMLQEKFAQNEVATQGATSTMVDEHVQKLTNDLRKDWGDDFGIKHKAANEAFEALSVEIPELGELMGWSPIVANHPAVLKLFEKLSPMVKDMGMTPGGSASGFGNDTVAGLKSQIAQLDADNKGLLFADITTLSIPDKVKREGLLKERTRLYGELYK